MCYYIQEEWCLRTYVLAGKRYLKGRQDRLSVRQFVFDAFVAYCEKDSKWVRNKLLSCLETENGLRLCIHERDFRCGEAIEENISYAIENSKRVILVISNAFFSSNWCVLEMRIARQMALERGHDILIPVILGRVDFSRTNKTMLNIMKEKTYIEWPEPSAEGHEFSRRRLLESLTLGKRCPDVL